MSELQAPAGLASDLPPFDLVVRDIRLLRGPSRWTYTACLEAVVDIGHFEDYPSNRIPGFTDRLVALLPSLIEHRCSPGVRGGFIQRLRDGTWAAHILEHLCLELQGLAGMPGGFGRARETEERGVYVVVVRAWEEQVTRAAFDAARALLLAVARSEPFDVMAAVDDLRDLIDRHYLGPSTACIVDAAHDASIPYLRLNDGNLVQLGYGCAQRRIWTAETDTTSAIAETVSRDKDLTKSLLEQCGVPVPSGRVVENEDEAWQAAESIGLPVVVKPTDGNHGRGVFIDVSSEFDVRFAYQQARREGSGVIVEQFIPGTEHRLLVVGNAVVAACQGEVAEIVGDGQHTVAQLVESQLNTDPRRGDAEECPLNLIHLNGIALSELGRQGLTPDAVPDVGQRVLIQRNGNMAFDVTEQVHPDTARLAVLAARVVGLNIAGIDLVVQDITQPLAPQRGAIVEVNAGPGLLMHLKPVNAAPRPVGKAIVEHLFADSTGRVPVVGVIASQSTHRFHHLLMQMLYLRGDFVGVATVDKLWLDRREVPSGMASPWLPGQRVLLNRSVQSAIIATDLAGLAGHGLPYDRCQVGVVLDMDVQARVPGVQIETEDHVHAVFRTQMDVVLRDGVGILNAEQPQVADLAQYCDGEVMFFARDPQHAVLQEARAAGRRVLALAAVGSACEAVAYQGEAVVFRVPLVGAAAADDRLHDLAAVAAAWALHVPASVICAGVETAGLV